MGRILPVGSKSRALTNVATALVRQFYMENILGPVLYIECTRALPDGATTWEVVLHSKYFGTSFMYQIGTLECDAALRNKIPRRYQEDTLACARILLGGVYYNKYTRALTNRGNHFVTFFFCGVRRGATEQDVP